MQINAAVSYKQRTRNHKLELFFRLVTNDLNVCFSAFYLCCSLPEYLNSLRPTGLFPGGSASFTRSLLFLFSRIGASSCSETYPLLSVFTAVSNGIWEWRISHIFSSVHKLELESSSHLFSSLRCLFTRFAYKKICLQNNFRKTAVIDSAGIDMSK